MLRYVTLRAYASFHNFKCGSHVVSIYFRVVPRERAVYDATRHFQEALHAIYLR